MKVDPSAIDSPLALIALFVAIIELFLLYPIAKLSGRDRSLLVVFVIAYPIFIAGSFFVFLWNKPVNLYKPQTLSESLQQALLPERLNSQLAPDRAAVTAIELKITSIEARLRDVSQQVQSGGTTATIGGTDVARLSDLAALKTELLARAQASGDVSPVGIASAAKEIRSEADKEERDRVALARAKTEEFASWLQQKGLKVRPVIPTIASKMSSFGPTISRSDRVIGLGPASRDYLAPGLYIYIVAYDQQYLTTGSSNSALVYITLDYMASRFAKINFPNPSGPIQEGTSRTHQEIYKFYTELSKRVGDNAVESGVINMLNEWNIKSDFISSIKSIETSLLKAGADAKGLSPVFDEFRTQFASIGELK